MWVLKQRDTNQWVRQDGPMCFNWAGDPAQATKFPEHSSAESAAKAIEILGQAPGGIIRVYQSHN